MNTLYTLHTITYSNEHRKTSDRLKIYAILLASVNESASLISLTF